ncbi:PaaI family thioesterase [Nitratifractor sp.]
MTELRTHRSIDPLLCGRVTELEEGRATVWFVPLEAMTADEWGLVHGGFLFGAADYAAMVAVNDPNVVLASSEIRFLAPVKKGQSVRFDARVVGQKGKRRIVAVEGISEGKPVFTGEFTAVIPDRHVLDREN